MQSQDTMERLYSNAQEQLDKVAAKLERMRADEDADPLAIEHYEKVHLQLTCYLADRK